MPTYKRGAEPSARHELLAAKPFVPDKEPPAQAAWVPKKLSMWGNADHGCCVTSEEAFAVACLSPEVFIPEKDVIEWAKSHDVLEGADLVSVLDWMFKKGFQQEKTLYNDGGKLGVNYADETVLRAAISKGPVKIAIDGDALPPSAGPPNGWHAFGGGDFPNPDHCVSLSGFGPMDYCFKQLGVPVPDGAPDFGYLLFTWSSIGVVDFPWILTTCVEAWVRIPTTVVVGPGPKPPPPGPTPGPVRQPLFIQPVDRFHRKGELIRLMARTNVPKGSSIEVYGPEKHKETAPAEKPAEEPRAEETKEKPTYEALGEEEGRGET